MDVLSFSSLVPLPSSSRSLGKGIGDEKTMKIKPKNIIILSDFLMIKRDGQSLIRNCKEFINSIMIIYDKRDNKLQRK